jgi:hypothetical protein
MVNLLLIGNLENILGKMIGNFIVFDIEFVSLMEIVKVLSHKLFFDD